MLDHLVLASGDLTGLIDAFRAATGVDPVPGGRHAVGTANALVPVTVLGRPTGSYLELIGPETSQTTLTEDFFGLATSGAPRVAAFAIRGSLEEWSARYRARGRDPWQIKDLSRQTPAGDLLRWRFVPPAPVPVDPVPFVIDWLDSPHPSGVAEPVIDLLSLRLGHPDPAVRAELAALSPVIEAMEAPPSLGIVLRTPHGVVTETDLGLAPGPSEH
jgi:hypothetical protein